MKSAISLLSALILGQVICSRVLAASVPRSSRPASSEKNQSWLFILEADTQWSLIVQNAPSPGEIRAVNSQTTPLAGLAGPNGGNSSGARPGVLGGATSSASTGNNPSSGHPGWETAASSGGVGTNVFTLEGNTEDAPLTNPVKPAKPNPPVKPVVPKPSAPDS